MGSNSYVFRLSIFCDRISFNCKKQNITTVDLQNKLNQSFDDEMQKQTKIINKLKQDYKRYQEHAKRARTTRYYSNIGCIE